MKKVTLLFVITLLPLMLLCGILTKHFPALSTPGFSLKNVNRGWRLTEVVTQDIINDTQFVNTDRFTYFYNSQYPDCLDSLRNDVFVDQNTWANQALIQYTYDVTHTYITGVLYKINTGTAYFPFMRGTFVYDNLHRLTLMMYEWYSGDAEIWNVSFWTMINYLGVNNYQVFEYEAAADGNPQTWKQKTLEFDTQGRIILETNQASNDSLNWVNSERTARSYVAWDTTTGADFINNIARLSPLQGEFSLFPDELMFGHVQASSTEVWENSEWTNNYEVFINYPENSLELTDWHDQNWFVDIGQWVPADQVFYTYDANHNLQVKLNQFYNQGSWSSQSRQVASWENFSPNQDETNPVLPDLEIRTAPNPFDAIVNISATSKNLQPWKAGIYNCKGQLIRSLESSTGTSLNWDGRDNQNQPIPCGIYLVRIQSGQAGRSVKILKLH